MGKSKQTIKKILMNRILLIVAIFLLLVFSSAFRTELLRRLDMRHEIDRIQQEITEVDKKNTQMKELIAYLKTNEFFEREARVKMGLAREDEESIVFTHLPKPVDITSNDDSGITKSDFGKDNRWKEYFFGK